MMALWAIILGYAWLIWVSGWLGVAAVAVHVGAMLLFMPKGK